MQKQEVTKEEYWKLYTELLDQCRATGNIEAILRQMGFVIVDD